MSRKLLLMGAMSRGSRNILYDNGTENVSWIEGYSYATGSQSKESAYLSLLPLKSGLSTIGERTYVTNKLVNLKNFSFLKISEVTGDSLFTQGESYLCIGTGQMDDRNTYTKRTTFSDHETTTITMDISTITTKLYIRIHAKAISGTGDNKTKIYKVWLE